MSQQPQPHHVHDAKQDESLKETFPASDAPSITPPPGTRRAEQTEAAHHAPGEPAPTGLPTSDRHATETAHAPDGASHEAHARHS
jgi:hypothetical protein